MRLLTAILAGAFAIPFIGCSSTDCKTRSTNPCGSGTTAQAERSAGECGAYVLIPAVYEEVCEDVEVESARVDKVRVEAVYQTVSVQELVTPGRWTQEVIPAAYRNETEQVMVTPARKEWRKVPCADVDIRTGEKLGDAYCLVEIPAVFKTQTKQCLVTAACTKRDYIPAVYRTVNREVLVHEAYDKEIPVAAKTASRSSQRLVTPARWEWRWGDECPSDEREMPPKASEPSPAPPFPVGSALPNTTIARVY